MSYLVTFNVLSEPCSAERESLEAALTVAIELEMDGATNIRILDQESGFEDGFWSFAEANGINPFNFAETNGLELAQWVQVPKETKLGRVVSLLWAIRAILIVIVAMPFGLIAGLLSKGRNCTPEELAADLKKLAEGTEDEWDWDILESVPIADQRLEAIRQEAIAVNFPPQEAERAKLGRLALKARALSDQI
jgi:hypothetical protein